MVEYRLNIGHGLLKYPLSILVLLLITACGPDSQQHRSQAKPTAQWHDQNTDIHHRSGHPACRICLGICSVPACRCMGARGIRSPGRFALQCSGHARRAEPCSTPLWGMEGTSGMWTWPRRDSSTMDLPDRLSWVGVWNTDRRFREYYPQAAYNALPDSVKAQLDEGRGAGGIHSDAYLRFLVEELLPFIRDSYPVNSGPDHTAVMGSSMGGLISLYALTRYPEVFGAAGNVSTHWPIMMENPDNRFAGPFFSTGSGPTFRRPTGTIGSTSTTEPKRWTLFMNRFSWRWTRSCGRRASGRVPISFRTSSRGAAHSEPSWAERVHIPLEFIMSPR